MSGTIAKVYDNIDDYKRIELWHDGTCIGWVDGKIHSIRQLGERVILQMKNNGMYSGAAVVDAIQKGDR